MELQTDQHWWSHADEPWNLKFLKHFFLLSNTFGFLLQFLFLLILGANFVKNDEI